MDITNRNMKIPGVNSSTNFKIERAYCFDFGNMSELGSIGVHDVVNLPSGEALIGVRAIVVDRCTSGGDAEIRFGLNCNGGSSEYIGEEIGIAGLSEGYVYSFVVNGVCGYGENILQLTVDGAKLSSGKILVIAESIPVDKFMNRG